MSDFGKHDWPIARKDYKCEWCGQNIPTGEKHFKFTGVWEGEWQSWRMHEECEDSCTMNDAGIDGFMPYENARPEKVVIK